MKRLLTVAHSPDPDDAFMFYGFLGNRVLPEGWRVKHVLKDIQSLNRDARQGLHDVTAISAAALPMVARKYWVMSVGASVGRGYGPIVVCRKDRKSAFGKKDWSGLKVATPGPETTAVLLMKLARTGWIDVNTRFDRVIDAVKQGSVDGGLIIHEGQLTFGDHGLVKALDLGRWWRARTGLPIPLGLDVVLKKRGLADARRVAGFIKNSIRLAYKEKTKAVAYALKYGRGISDQVGERFVKMYVNRDTLDMGAEGERALRTLFRLALARRLIPSYPDFKVIRPLHEGSSKQ